MKLFKSKVIFRGKDKNPMWQQIRLLMNTIEKEANFEFQCLSPNGQWMKTKPFFDLRTRKGINNALSFQEKIIKAALKARNNADIEFQINWDFFYFDSLFGQWNNVIRDRDWNLEDTKSV